MYEVNFGRRIVLVLFALIAFSSTSQGAAELDPRLSLQIPQVPPGTWCLYQESGHMIPWSRVIVLTNGSVFAWKDYDYKHPLPVEPEFQETLTPEEKRYLGMWLEVTDIMNVREGRRSSLDSVFELLVFQDGKTNVLPELWGPKLTPILNFFFVAKGSSGEEFRGRMYRLLRRKVRGEDGSLEPLEVLKSYLKTPKRADYASEALRVLGCSMPANDWGEVLRGCLREANPAQRRILTEAIENWNLRARLSQEYRQQMTVALEGIGLVPLPLKLPQPTWGDVWEIGEPSEGPHIEKMGESNRPRPSLLVRKGITNLALGKKVTTSAAKIYTGTLNQITDGAKEPYDEHVVEMRKGVQWVQIDLEKEYAVYAIVIWHDARWRQAFHDVVVQASNDPEFKQGVATLFNNDYDETAGLGKGTDKEYIETHEGKLLDSKGIKARYFRFYSNGSNRLAWNSYQEIEIYGLP